MKESYMNINQLKPLENLLSLYQKKNNNKINYTSKLYCVKKTLSLRTTIKKASVQKCEMQSLNWGECHALSVILGCLCSWQLFKIYSLLRVFFLFQTPTFTPIFKIILIIFLFEKLLVKVCRNFRTIKTRPTLNGVILFNLLNTYHKDLSLIERKTCLLKARAMGTNKAESFHYN